MRMHNMNIIQPVETIINEYKDIEFQIDILEIRKKQLRSQLTDHYFNNTDTLYCYDGLVIATYKSYMTPHFKSCDFKLDHPDIYKIYTETREQKRLLIK